MRNEPMELAEAFVEGLHECQEAKNCNVANRYLAEIDAEGPRLSINRLIEQAAASACCSGKCPTADAAARLSSAAG